jgi:hypothetical protein
MQTYAQEKTPEPFQNNSAISKFSKGILDSKLELWAFVFVLVGGALIAAYKFLEVSRASSLEWDSASFLTNAAVYAGFNQYHQALDPTRPPVIPFLLSLGFRINGPVVTDGYLLSAIFYLLAILGTFLLAKEMMHPILAVLASMSYGVAPLVFQWSGILLSDVEGVAVASLALSALVISAKRNHKLLLWAIPLLLLAPLTHYSLAVVIPVAVIYLFAAGKADWIMDNYEFYYGIGLSMVVFVIFAGQWIAYPFLNHTTISVIFPQASAVTPFGAISSPWFYMSHFPEELGAGSYGDFLAILFVLCITYLAVMGLLRKLREVNPVAVALASWFLLLFLYYSFGFATDDLRYSIEFAMPIILLSYYIISIVLSKISLSLSAIKKDSSKALSVAMIILVATFMALFFYQSASTTLVNSQPVEKDLNAALKQAVSWLKANVPTNQKLQCNWYTLLWWYAPYYNITASPLSYQLTSAASYKTWQNTLISNQIAYIVYVDPGSQLFLEMTTLKPVFTVTLSGAQVVVFQVK